MTATGKRTLLSSVTSTAAFEGARSFGGLRADPDNMTRYFSSHHRGEGVGIYAMDINRGGKTWDLATSWGDNGYAPMPNLEGMWIAQFEPWEGMLVATNWSIAEVPASSVEIFDKTSGAHMRSLDVSEIFQHERFDDEGASRGFFAAGPSTMSTTAASGSLVSDRFQQKVDWDGNYIWLKHRGQQGSRRRPRRRAACQEPGESGSERGGV